MPAQRSGSDEALRPEASPSTLSLMRGTLGSIAPIDLGASFAHPSEMAAVDRNIGYLRRTQFQLGRSELNREPTTESIPTILA